MHDGARIDVHAEGGGAVLLHALGEPSPAAAHLEQTLVGAWREIAGDASKVPARLDGAVEHSVVLRVVRHADERARVVGEAQTRGMAERRIFWTCGNDGWGVPLGPRGGRA